MAVEVEIRRYQRRDQAGAIGLLLDKVTAAQRQHAYEEKLARWKWQYYENPNIPGDEAPIWVAQVGESIAGMVATVPVRLRTPRGPVLGLWGVDFMVDSRMRGMGIGRKLLTEWLKHPGVKMVVGWSPVSFRVATGVGFRVVWGFSMATIALSRWRYGIQLLRDSKRREFLELLRGCWKPGRKIPVKFSEIDVCDRLPQDTAQLWSRVAEGYRFAVDRDDAYLNWRFVRHPSHRYHYVKSCGSTGLQGLAICRLTAESPPLGIVSDILVDPGQKGQARDLMEQAICFLKSQGACGVIVDLPPALSGTLLEGHGCRLQRDLGMIVCTSDPDSEPAGMFSPEHWYISRSDSDRDY